MEQTVKNIIENKNAYGDMTLLDRMKHYHIPSVSIAVIKDYEIETAFAIGVKEWGREESATISTVYQAASVSKPVFASAVMKLHEMGILNIDEDINKYVQGFKVTTESGEIHKTTLRQILCHSAGFSVHGFAGCARTVPIPSLTGVINGEGNSDKVVIKVENIGHAIYSGGGFCVAQKVVEDILGKPLPIVMDELILTPHRMTSSTYSQPITKYRLKDCALGYYKEYTPVDTGFHVYPEKAAAGLWTTPSDLARFGIAVQKSIVENNGWIRKNLLQDMITVQNAECESIGISFFLGKNYFGHQGCNEGYLSLLFLSKENGCGVVIMVNTDDGVGFREEIFQAIAEVCGFPKEF